MPTADASIIVDDAEYTGRVTDPDQPTDSGVLMLQGAGQGPYGGVFDAFATAAADAGHLVARFETWADREELRTKTEEDFRQEIAAGLAYLRSAGCETRTVVAKSFGARLALTHGGTVADRLVLWAPSVLVDHDGKDPSVAGARLAGMELPVLIVHGDEDDVVSMDTAATIADSLPQGRLVEIPGEDHSFTNRSDQIVTETLSFLPDGME